MVTGAVWFFRYTLFDLLYAWNGVRPSDGMLLGTILMAAALACVPIVAFHFTHMQVSYLLHSTGMESSSALKAVDICS